MNTLLFNIILFCFACFLLMKTTRLFVRGAVEAAYALSLSKIFIGITLVSFITTLPEFIVSVASSFTKQGEVAVGTAIGSCICNMGLIFGVGAFMRDVRVSRNDLTYKIGLYLVSLIAVFLLSLDGRISRIDGLIMIVAAAAFLSVNYRMARKEKTDGQNGGASHNGRKTLTQSILILMVGGGLTVLIAKYGLLDTAIRIADGLKVPPRLIAFSVIALGTSLPELFTAIISSRHAESDIALGNVIGANMLNVLWVMGAAAVILPLPVDRQTLFFSFPVAIGIAFIMYILGRRRFNFARRDGIVLLSVYIIYIALLCLVIYK